MKSATKVEEEAAEWLVRRKSGLAPEEEARFQAWLFSDSSNAAALDELEGVWRTVNLPGDLGQSGVLLDRLQARERHRSKRRRAVVAGAAGLAAAAVIAFSLISPRVPLSSVPAAEPSTVMVRPDRQVLADGSTLDLNAGTQISVAFTADRREIKLLRGEALFAVTKDPNRPFIVTAGGVEVRAVGTAFTVRFDPKQVDVLVTEGRVAVRRSADGTDLLGTEKPVSATETAGHGSLVPPLLAAGQSVAIPVEAMASSQASAPLIVHQVSPEEIAAGLAWRGSRVEFTRTPLSEAIRLFNGRSRIQLFVSDPATANLKISGVFWADDPEGFVRLLEKGFGVKSTSAAGTITLGAAIR